MTVLRSLCIALIVSLTTIGFGIQGAAGPYRVELTSDPAILPVGKASLDIFLTDSSGHPVDGAHIRAIAQMPNMPMGEREQDAITSVVPGHYKWSQAFSMEGSYDARIEVSGPSGNGTAVIALATGKSTATKSGTPPSLVSKWPWLVGLAAVVLLIIRLRKTGQRVDMRAVLSRTVVSSILFLGLVLIGAIYIVNHLRKSGAMTPIEAQTMNMDMPPPEGVTPVTLAEAHKGLLGASAEYAGQAVGYQEISVAARTTGVVLWMPSYVGTVVRKGELIARLDTTELGPQVRVQRAATDMARRGISVAQADERQAKAMIHEAEAEHGQYQGAVEEANAELTAAREDAKAAQADVVAANADLGDAQARAAATHADRDYWAQELSREAKLFSSGAVSKDDFQHEQAESAKSEAVARQADQGITASRAKVEAAVARSRKATAMTEVAHRKLDQAASALMAHHAHVQSAEAEAAAADEKIDQARSGASQAEAELAGTIAQANYAEIRAEDDGVVTERTVSPGSLVSAGQVLLKISTVKPIRLQANVPQGDLGKIRVGSMAMVAKADQAGSTVSAAITTISPSVDPVSRTAIVEAIYSNGNKTFSPGQFISMRISLGGERDHLVIPAAAVQSSVSSSDAIQASTSSMFVWVAVPAQGREGSFTVSRRTLRLGPTSGDQIAVESGLSEGDKVVVTGAAGLQDGQTVEAPGIAEHQTSSASAPVVKITEAGFVPPQLEVSAAKHQVTFLRTTNNTCAKEVVFPDLKIRRDLPLNKPITIDLPPTAAGELHYVCGMNMLKGTVVIR